MDYLTFFDRVARLYWSEGKDQGQRIGQFYFNYLRSIAPVAAANVPQDVDPFYDDKRLHAFCSYLALNWDHSVKPYIL